MTVTMLLAEISPRLPLTELPTTDTDPCELLAEIVNMEDAGE